GGARPRLAEAASIRRLADSTAAGAVQGIASNESPRRRMTRPPLLVAGDDVRRHPRANRSRRNVCDRSHRSAARSQLTDSVWTCPGDSIVSGNAAFTWGLSGICRLAFAASFASTSALSRKSINFIPPAGFGPPLISARVLGMYSDPSRGNSVFGLRSG